MTKELVDYAVYDGRRQIIEHLHVPSPELLGELLYEDGIRSIQDEVEGMTIFHVGDRRYITMAGRASKNSDALWSWRLLEFRSPHEEGAAMSAPMTFDTVKERHYAPIAFMDKEDLDADHELTLQVFRPADTIHYPLSSTGYVVQRTIMNLARTKGKGVFPTRWLDN